MHTILRRAAFGPVSALFAALTFVVHPATGQAEGLQFSVGIAAGASQSPFDTADPKASVLPDFLIEGEHFSLGTSGLSVTAYQSGPLTLSARIAPRWVAADPADVAGLEALKRRTAVEAGVAAHLTFGGITAQAEALKDVSGTHGGKSFSVALSTGAELTDRLSVGARAGAVWMDKNLATYSYGVRTSEAGGGLAAYGVRAVVIPSIGVEARFAVNENVSVVGGIQAEFLPVTVARSPIVKRDTLISAMIGVRYAF